MFPTAGKGFVWDPTAPTDDGYAYTLFIPDSRKIFNVAIPRVELAHKLHATDWITWETTGVRDAALPHSLYRVTHLESAEEEAVRPEFMNQTTFRSVLIFPTSEKHIKFIGEGNAWSAHVGIVSCKAEEITPGAYCVGYIERDYSRDESAFIVNANSLKFPDGFCSRDDRFLFESLEGQIEDAMEEAIIMASKGRTAPVAQVLQRPQDDADYGFELVAQGSASHSRHGSGEVVQTPDIHPRWTVRRSKQDINQIMNTAAFLNNDRVHPIFVYKPMNGGIGFIGYAPLIGSIPIRALSHKLTDQPVEVGEMLRTRVEYDKKSRTFFVETVSAFETPLMKFTVIPSPVVGNILQFNCTDLDLSKFTVATNSWRYQRWVIIDHPIIHKVLVKEGVANNPKYQGKKVRANICHYEGFEDRENPPGRIRLVAQILGLAETDSSPSLEVAEIVVGNLDDVESDEEESYSDINDREVEEDMGIQKHTWEDYDQGFSSASKDKEDSFEFKQCTVPMAEGIGFDAPAMPAGDGDQKNVIERGFLVTVSPKSSMFWTESRTAVEYKGDAYECDMQLGDSAQFQALLRPAGMKSTAPYVVIVRKSKLMKIGDIFFNERKVEGGKLKVCVNGLLDVKRNEFHCEIVTRVNVGHETNFKIYSGGSVHKNRLKIGHSYNLWVVFNPDTRRWRLDCIDNRYDGFELEESEDEIDMIKRELKQDKNNKRLSGGSRAQQAMERSELSRAYEERRARWADESDNSLSVEQHPSNRPYHEARGDRRDQFEERSAPSRKTQQAPVERRDNIYHDKRLDRRDQYQDRSAPSHPMQQSPLEGREYRHEDRRDYEDRSAPVYPTDQSRDNRYHDVRMERRDQYRSAPVRPMQQASQHSGDRRERAGQISVPQYARYEADWVVQSRVPRPLSPPTSAFRQVQLQREYSRDQDRSAPVRPAQQAPQRIADRRDQYSDRLAPVRPAQQAPSHSTVTNNANTITPEKAMRKLRAKQTKLKRMLKTVWGYKGVQKHLKHSNFYMYECIEEWFDAEAEDESERSANPYAAANTKFDARTIRKDMSTLKRYLSCLWDFPIIRQIIEADNDFLYTNVCDFFKYEKEDELMEQQGRQ